MPRILLATDADWIHEDVDAALAGDDIEVLRLHQGVDVLPTVHELAPDLVVLDLQIGTLGGIAVTMALRLAESAGTLPPVNILVLLDRTADVHLARRSGADGWLVKPLDALRLRRAALAVAGGLQHHDGVTITPVSDDTDDDTDDDTVTDGDATTFSASADVEPAPAG